MADMVDVKGKVRFIHAVNFNKYDKWSIVLEPDNDSRQKIYDLTLKNVMKKDEDNTYFIQFSREPTKLIRGKVVAFAAPRVFDSKGVLMDGNKVGRGSDVTVRLEVYKYGPPQGGKAQAARWDSLRVDNLVEWQIDKDMPPTEAEAAKDLVNSPKPVWD